MKKSCCLFLFLIVFSQLPATSLLSQELPLPLALVAEKNNTKKYYRLGDAVRIEFKDNGNPGRIKGLITKISTDSIEVSSFNGKMKSQFVAINSLVSITRLNRKQRKNIVIIGAILAVIIGTIALLTKGSIFVSAWGFALVGIPAIGLAVYLFIFLGFTLLAQLAGKHSVNKGWKFSAEEAPPKRRGFFDLLFRR